MEAETIRLGQVSSIANAAGRSPRQFRTWQSHRLMATSFGWAKRGSRARSGSVNGTRGVDSQEAVPVIHKPVSPNLLSSQSVTAILPATGWPLGEIGGGRERPPLFAARCGHGGVVQFTFAQHPLGGSLPSQISLAGRPDMTPVVWQATEHRWVESRPDWSGSTRPRPDRL